MYNPTVRIDTIKKFIVDVVKAAGPDACPPYVVGIGIGGTANVANLMAKKALLRRINKHHAQKRLSILEKDLLNKINKLNIGPMGLGGKTTALAVAIETFPTHIAGLPVAINISCHALRSATKIL
jgi:fumarate hydratase subunit alpha